MKKHLFYTFLTIFAITAALTLLGITDVIPIRDQYLTPLFAAFLIELLGAVIGLYKGTKFFEDEGYIPTMPSAPRVQESATAKQSIPFTQFAVEVSPPIVSTPSGAMDLSKYLDQLSHLDGRFHDSERLRKDTHGKLVSFVGKVDNVVSIDDDSTMVMLYEKLHGAPVGALLDKTHQVAAFSLRKGDWAHVVGIVNLEDLPGRARINASSISRVGTPAA